MRYPRTLSTPSLPKESAIAFANLRTCLKHTWMEEDGDLILEKRKCSFDGPSPKEIQEIALDESLSTIRLPPKDGEYKRRASKMATT